MSRKIKRRDVDTGIRTLWVTEEGVGAFEMAAEAIANEWSKVVGFGLRVHLTNHRITALIEGSMQTDFVFSVGCMDGHGFRSLRCGSIATRTRMVRFVIEELEDLVAKKTVQMLLENS